MRQRAFNRPVPIKTNLTVKAELHETDDHVLPLPLTPLTPRTELELRRSCRILLSLPPTSAYAASPATTKPTKPTSLPPPSTSTLTSPTSSEKLELLRHLYAKPHPPPPPPLADPPLSPDYICAPSTARKFSVIDIRASTVSPSPVTVLRRRPTLINVSPGARPKTADIRTRRVLDRINQGGEQSERHNLGLFPARPSTSHAEKPGAFKIDLMERPLPPLPAVKRSQSDSEVIMGKEKESKGLKSLRKQISSWFGKKKHESAAVAA